MNIKKIMIWLVSTYLLLIALLFIFQRNLQYLPDGKIADISTYKLEGFKEEKITTEDGVKILAWFKPAKKGEKIILFFHGNAGNLAGRAHVLEAFSKHGFGVLAISYRGYPGSEGKPSEDGLTQDGEAAFKFLLDRGYLPQDIILFGESLGSGIAVKLSAKFDFFAVVLESPFSSIAGVAKKRYWFAPVNLILKDRFDSISLAPKISAPVLILHGTADQVVSFDEGKKLFDAIKSPKKFIEVQGAGHIRFGDEFLVDQIKQFITEIKKK